MPVDPSSSRFCNSAKIRSGSTSPAAAARRARSSRSFCLSAKAASITTSSEDKKSETFMRQQLSEPSGASLSPGSIGSAQTIADAGLGENVLRLLRVGLDLLPELAHVYP